MNRPPIEETRNNAADDLRYEMTDYELEQTKRTIAVCDYALALERKLEAVRKALDKERFLCGLCIAMKDDIEQALEEEP